ncbi:MAG: single-stranded-DNA-specific exonuclease RecJ [Chlamydiia bacterium]|nr:single-stranded-DNA-specific exonuclease RecJ [Chlamydiia bacterium]
MKQEENEVMWIPPKRDPSLKEKIVQEFNIHPIVAQILVSRGFTSIKAVRQHLYSRLPNLHDPFLMEQMPAAVARISHALENHENILIYGDNDVDGMTGTALLTEFLKNVGANVFYYISNRSMRRQSLIVEALEYAQTNNCTLLITVDCGITAASEIEQLTEQHVDVIITDHHEPTGTIPHCVATLNPKLTTSTYPNRDLTGVGVAFKLAHALLNHLSSEGKCKPKEIDLKSYLDLVALGTISDMGALLGENRILVGYGIKQLKRTKRVGLSKLMSLLHIDIRELNTFTIASKIAPPLNSLGRIADPSKGVQMLLVRDTTKAEQLAKELDLNNLERQKIEKGMVLEVENIINIHPEMLTHNAIVIESENWHPGVIAILSTRICKQYNRPTVMIAIEKEIAKGSIRSISEFPLLDQLKESSDILLNFGGHDLAAGMTLMKKDIPEFKKRFIKAADKLLSKKDVVTKIPIDAAVDFKDLNFEFMESLKLLEPWGNENPPPVFVAKAKQAWPPRIYNKQHLKLFLEQNDWILEGIAYGQASACAHLKRGTPPLEIAFTPQINTSQGMSIQCVIRGFKVTQDTEKSPTVYDRLIPK